MKFINLSTKGVSFSMVLDPTLNGENMRFWLTFFIGFVFAHFLSIWHEEDIIQQLRACSYDPAYRDVSLTDDLASYLFSYKILHCVHMRKRAGPLAEISFEFAEIIGRRDENFPYEHASPLTGMKSNKSCRFNLTLFTWFYVCFVNKY